MRRRSSIRLRLARVTIHAGLAMVSALVAAGCDDDDEYPYGDSACRFDPSYCAGGLGGSCRNDVDCFDGFCCTDKHCGRGTCTLSCDTDLHCPPDMACEHNVCLFSCRSDLDCAVGQRCEHGRTVCEWP